MDIVNKNFNRANAIAHLCSGYMPSFAEIVANSGLARDCLEQDAVQIPVPLFRLLLAHAVAQETFDAQGYARKNPDVARAVDKGELESLHAHYVLTGWLEGRVPGRYRVDEKWYLEQYRDVAQARMDDAVRSGTEHYNSRGRLEGRAANPMEAAALAAWRTAFGH